MSSIDDAKRGNRGNPEISFSNEEKEKGVYQSLEQIIEANSKTKQDWFNEKTIAKLSIRFYSFIYKGMYFISSADYNFGGPSLFQNVGRKYTIHLCDKDGWISSFNEEIYESLAQAEAALIPYLRGSGPIRKVPF